MRARRVRRVAAIVTIGLLATGCMGHGGGGGETATGPGTTGVSVSAAANETAQSLEATLAGAGIATVADETSTTPVAAVTRRTVFTVTEWQAVNMQEEIAGHSGIVGSDLNAMLPMPPKTPQFDDIIGGWIVSKVDADAVAAGQILGPQDWNHPDQVVYPTAVLTMFMSDLLEHIPAGTIPTTSASASASTTASDASYQGPPLVGHDDDVVGAACSTAASFVQNVLGEVFAALTLDPSKVGAWVNGALGGGLAGLIGGSIASFLASFWNDAVALAKKTLEEVIRRIGAPVIAAMTVVIGGVAVFTTIRSYLKQWTIDVTGLPKTNMFGITPNPETGSLMLTIDKHKEVEDWPQGLVACAESIGVSFPTLAKQGSPATWTIGQPIALITPDGPLKTTLNGELTTSLPYKTGTESERLRTRGVPQTGVVKASVMVERPEVQQLRDFVAHFLSSAIASQVNLGPVQKYVEPILSYYINQATTFLNPLTDVRGVGILPVTYHVPKPCSVDGGAIPEGTYKGTYVVHIKTTVKAGPVSQYAAAHGRADGAGSVTIDSDGDHVTGSITLHGTDSARSAILDIGDSGNGGIDGKIYGSAKDPKVKGTLTGHDEIAGDSTIPYNAGLHLTSVTCPAISGDIIPMLREIVGPRVLSVLTIGGQGDWTAKREN